MAAPASSLSGRAVSMIREQPHYRREAFEAGLSAIGLTVERVPPAKWRPGDVLVIWNRYGRFAAAADACEAAGGTVVVAENPYVGTAGEQYALALDHHKGPGRWFAQDDGGERWRRLGVTIEPWRGGGEYLLLAPERGIGSPQFAMPRDWPAKAEADLRAAGERVRVRLHPGRHAPDRTLVEDLAGAAGVVTWGSNVGITALLMGIPVWHGMLSWLAAPAATWWRTGPLPPNTRLRDRETTFHRIAWAQWTVEEIAAGDAFRHLLRESR